MITNSRDHIDYAISIVESVTLRLSRHAAIGRYRAWKQVSCVHCTTAHTELTVTITRMVTGRRLKGPDRRTVGDRAPPHHPAHGTEPFRSQANSLPGANRPIGPWPIRSLELLLPGLLAPWPFRSRERKFYGTFAPLMCISPFAYTDQNVLN